MDFLRWYKNTIESCDQEPPESVWENIQDELDIEQSWQVINQHLTRKSIARRNTVIAIAASWLVLISIGTWWYFLPDKHVESSQVLAEGTNETQRETVNPETGTPEPLVLEENTEVKSATVVTESRQEVFIENTLTQQEVVEMSEESEGERSPQQTPYTMLENRMIAMNSEVNNEMIMKEPTLLPDEEVTNQRTSFRKLYIGSTGQLANTWLLNEKTFSGLEPSSLTTSDVSLGSSFGVFLGTNLAEKINLQMDFNILAQNNQVYHEYLDGHYVENKMKFNYSQLALSLRFSFVTKRVLSGEHGVNVGGYAGYLHNAFQHIGSETINLSSEYNWLDYGIFLGYEYMFPIYQQLGLGTGFRVYYGLQNIYSGNDYIPGYLNKTNIASANITLSLKYLIK